MGASMCASSAHRDPAYVRSRGVPSVQSLSVPTNIRPVPSTRPSAGPRARADVACGPCERTRTARSPARIARRSSGRLEMLLDRPRTARAVHLKRPLNLPIPAPKHVRDAKTTLETAAKRLLEPTKARDAILPAPDNTRVCAIGRLQPRQPSGSPASHRTHDGRYRPIATRNSSRGSLAAALTRRFPPRLSR